MNGPAESVVYAFEGFELDPGRRRLSRADGEAIPLGPKAFDTLLYLVERPGELVEKYKLMEAVWPHVVVEENNLNQAITTLRRVLGDHHGERRFIETEPRRGYRFVATVATSTAGTTTGRDPDGQAAVGRLAFKAKKLRHVPYTGIAVTIALIVASLWFWHRDDGTAVQSSVAVLPFENDSPDPDKAYVADSIYDEVLNQLGKITELQVVTPRLSGLRYADSDLSLPEIAEELGVGLIMGGSVRYADDQMRATVWLVDAESNRQTWSETYTNNVDDPFAIESGIARDVAFQLSIELSPAEEACIRRLPTDSWEARGLFLEAVSLGRSVRSLDLLERALKIDPEFSPAYALRAWIYAGTLINSVNGNVARNWVEIEQQILDDVDSALSIDRDAFLAHRARGSLREHVWRWSEARRDFDRLRSLYPNVPGALRDYIEFSYLTGAYKEAISTAKRLRDITKNWPVGWYYLGLAYAFAGQPEDAKEALQIANVSGGGTLVAALYIGLMEARLGNDAEAAAQFTTIERRLGDSILLAILPSVAVGYALIDGEEKAAQLGERILDADSADVDIGARAMAYLALGDRERLAETLERAVARIRKQEPDSGFFNLMVIKHNVMDHRMLEEPRFRGLREQLTGI